MTDKSVIPVLVEAIKEQQRQIDSQQQLNAQQSQVIEQLLKQLEHFKNQAGN